MASILKAPWHRLLRPFGAAAATAAAAARVDPGRSRSRVIGPPRVSRPRKQQGAHAVGSVASLMHIDQHRQQNYECGETSARRRVERRQVDPDTVFSLTPHVRAGLSACHAGGSYAWWLWSTRSSAPSLPYGQTLNDNNRVYEERFPPRSMHYWWHRSCVQLPQLLFQLQKQQQHCHHWLTVFLKFLLEQFIFIYSL